EDALGAVGFDGLVAGGRKLLVSETDFRLRPFPVLDLDRGSEPLDHLARLVAQGNGPAEKPAVFAVMAPDAVFPGERPVLQQRVGPVGKHGLPVVGMNGRKGSVAKCLLDSKAGVLVTEP